MKRNTRFYDGTKQTLLMSSWQQAALAARTTERAGDGDLGFCVAEPNTLRCNLKD